MSAGLIGACVLVAALFYLALSIAYAVGAFKAARDLDGTFEIAKALGAYGQILRTEAEALGVTVEELLARDAERGAPDGPL